MIERVKRVISIALVILICFLVKKITYPYYAYRLKKARKNLQKYGVSAYMNSIEPLIELNHERQ